MHLLIDSDSLCYKAGFVCNEEGQEFLANWQLNLMIEELLAETQAESWQLFLTGANNFRYDIYPEYKANRVGMVRPTHLQSMREFLVTDWKAVVTDGIEADDAVGIAAYAKLGQDVVMAHIDKDLDLLEGKHYNFNKREWYDVNQRQGWHNFCMQLIQGDKGDNIPGYDGKMRPKLPKFLYGVRDALEEDVEHEDMLARVAKMYPSYATFKQSADCLWIQRKENDKWEHWIAPEWEVEMNEWFTMADCGPEDDSIAL